MTPALEESPQALIEEARHCVASAGLSHPSDGILPLIDRLASALERSLEENQWRPIESAQCRPGQRLLVARAGDPHSVMEAWWTERELEGFNPDEGECGPFFENFITHWRPLPPPPEQKP